MKKTVMKKILGDVVMSAIAAVIIGFVLASPAAAQTSEAASASYPPDIDKRSGFRLPIPNRQDIDVSDRAAYDAVTSGESIAGLQGPGGIRLYSLKTSPHFQAILGYLRHDAGIPANVFEIAILSVARAMDSKFEWAAHEPLARKAGVSEATIEAIKRRGPVSGLPETDALVIELARETLINHRVSPETFASAKKAFGPNKLVDIVLLMGDYSRTAALLTAFDVQLHPGEVSDLPIP